MLFPVLWVPFVVLCSFLFPADAFGSMPFLAGRGMNHRFGSAITMLEARSKNTPAHREIAPHNDDSLWMRQERRGMLKDGFLIACACLSAIHPTNVVAAYSGPTIDVNNAMTREFSAFPGLYPTIGTKIINGAKNRPYKTKQEIYAVLDSDLEKDRLRQYDAALVIQKPDRSVQQFKASQICKYECGNRVSSSYRDQQIREVQEARRTQ